MLKENVAFHRVMINSLFDKFLLVYLLKFVKYFSQKSMKKKSVLIIYLLLHPRSTLKQNSRELFHLNCIKFILRKNI